MRICALQQRIDKLCIGLEKNKNNSYLLGISKIGARYSQAALAAKHGVAIEQPILE